MNADAEDILEQLRVVETERQRRAFSTDLSARVEAVKTYQRQRFALTYTDLLSAPRYAAAARFFLDELYGPADFSKRDSQFARVVPAMTRLFPKAITQTVAMLARLHALSEQLDSALASHVGDAALGASGYVAAWRATGREAERERQIELVLSVAHALDRLTRKPLLHATLRMMRGPASTAGLSELQAFLERGFETFRDMRGADEFLSIIGRRERELVHALFGAPPAPPEPGDGGFDPALLGQLPW